MSGEAGGGGGGVVVSSLSRRSGSAIAGAGVEGIGCCGSVWEVHLWCGLTELLVDVGCVWYSMNGGSMQIEMLRADIGY